jgi:transcriptional regulator with XRE-family HTH domain
MQANPNPLDGYRVLHGLTYRELSLQVGLSYHTVRNVCMGKSHPRAKTITAIAEGIPEIKPMLWKLDSESAYFRDVYSSLSEQAAQSDSNASLRKAMSKALNKYVLSKNAELALELLTSKLDMTHADLFGHLLMTELEKHPELHKIVADQDAELQEAEAYSTEPNLAVESGQVQAEPEPPPPEPVEVPEDQEDVFDFSSGSLDGLGTDLDLWGNNS